MDASANDIRLGASDIAYAAIYGFAMRYGLGAVKKANTISNSRQGIYRIAIRQYLAAAKRQ